MEICYGGHRKLTRVASWDLGSDAGAVDIFLYIRPGCFSLHKPVPVPLAWDAKPGFGVPSWSCPLPLRHIQQPPSPVAPAPGDPCAPALSPPSLMEISLPIRKVYWEEYGAGRGIILGVKQGYQYVLPPARNQGLEYVLLRCLINRYSAHQTLGSILIKAKDFGSF